MHTEDLFIDNSGTPIPATGGPPDRAFRLPLSSSEDRWRNYPSRDQRPARLTQILEDADAGNPRDLFEFEEEMVEKDLKIRSAYRTRKTALLGVKWEVVAAPARIGEEELADDIAANVRRWIERAPDLREMRKHQFDGLGKPFAVSWINWKTVDEPWEFTRPDGTVERRELLTHPESFTPMAGRRFRWNEAASFKKGADPTDQLLYFENLNDRVGRALPGNGTIRSLFNDQSDHPTRGGLLRAFLFPYAFKITSMKDWISYVDKNGTPIRVLTISADDFNDADIFARILASVRDLGSNAHGIFPDTSKIEIHAPVGDVQVFKETCDYIDKAFAQAILGHELSSQASPGEGNLGISAAERVRQDVLEGDAEDYAPMEARDLYRPLVGFNYGWDLIHLTPNLKFETEPPKDLAARANVLSSIGRAFKDMPFSKQQFRKEFTIDPPVGFNLDTENDVMYAALSPSFFVTADPKTGEVPDTPDAGQFQEAGVDEDLDLEDADDEADEDVPTGPRALAAAALIAAATEGGGSLVRLKPSQRTVDRIANRAISASQSELLAMAKPIRRVIRQAVKEGWDHRRLLRAVMDLFPTLELKRTERLQAQSRTIARIYGRTARVK